MESVRLRYAVVAPLRLALSIVWVVAAWVVGAPSATVLLAYAAGAVLTLVLLLQDPRARFRRAIEPLPLPDDARVAPAWVHAAHAAFPSTVGVSVLAAVALFGRPTLAAVLAGILAGLGVWALLSAYWMVPDLYVDLRRGVVYRK